MPPVVAGINHCASIQQLRAEVHDFESHSGNRSVPAPGDYDGDGNFDLICSNAAGKVYFYRNDGSGNLKPGIEIASGQNRGWTYPVDWDGDGKLDVTTFSTGTVAATMQFISTAE